MRGGDYVGGYSTGYVEADSGLVSVYFGLINKLRGWTFELIPFLDLWEVQNVTAGQQELLNFVSKSVELAVLALLRYLLSCRVIYWL